MYLSLGTLLPTRPAGALLAPEELHLALAAGYTRNKSRDVCDIVGAEDSRYAGELAVPALQTRLARFPAHATTHFFPWPKATPGQLRSMVCADAFDEAIDRGVVGDIATVVDLSLGPEVQSYRLRRFSPTWALRNYRYGDAERRVGPKTSSTRRSLPA